MTVKELIEKLEDYGEHLEVEVITTDERRHRIAEIDSTSRSEGVIVELIL